MSASRDYFVSTYAWIEKPLRETVAELVDGGWKAIEIMCEGRHGELLDWSEERLALLKRIGQDNGISWSLHAPITGCNPASSDTETILASASLLQRTLQIAEELGCAYVVVHPGEREEKLDDPNGNDNEAANRVVSFLQRVLKATEGYEVIIALENVPPYPGLLGVEASFLKQVVQKADSPRVRIVFDVGHAHLTGKGQCLMSLQNLLPYVIGLHLSDNRGETDDHLRLGEGTVPLEGVLTLIRQFQYSGSWILELRAIADVFASFEWLDLRRTGFGK